MSDFRVALATPADEAELRGLLAANPVPGEISIAYRREPDYFLGCGPLGDFCQVLAARHLASGRLAGLASRSGRHLYVAGVAQPVGYLGQLRIAREFRSRWLVAQGFRALHELHGDDRTPFYLTTVIDGNREAEGVLVQRPRRGFPRYLRCCGLETLALPVGRSRRSQLPAGVVISHGDDLPLATLLEFWATVGARRQYFPCWRAADFAPDAPLTRGLLRRDILVARRGETILGTLALWDQSAYKQSQVCGYRSRLAALRPLYNLLARCSGRPRLPAVGSVLAVASAALPCVRDASPEVFTALLDQVLQLAAARQRDWLLLGLCDDDPLLAIARAYPHVAYRSSLYAVAWDGDPLPDLGSKGPHHVEIAAL